jgi:hypothetical protein
MRNPTMNLTGGEKLQHDLARAVADYVRTTEHAPTTED